MKKTLFFLFSFAVTFGLFNNCSKDTEFTKNLNYIAFESTSLSLGVDIGGSTTHTVTVYTSNTASSDRTFKIMAKAASSTAVAGAYTLPETVTVPANSNKGSFELELHDVSIGDGKKLVLTFDGDDGLFTGNDVTISITQICPLNEVVLKINFDGYASECSWELLNAASAVVASGDGYTDGTKSFTTKFCLENGTYTFKIYDDYGDGLGTGNAQLSKGSSVLYSVSGDFGFEDSGTFTVTL